MDDINVSSIRNYYSRKSINISKKQINHYKCAISLENPIGINRHINKVIDKIKRDYLS